MAAAVMPSTISPPDVRTMVSALLSALPAAAMSSQPAPSTLKLLSPILRQRVQILSAAANEPWLRLLCYQPSQVSQLSEIARSAKLEPHPVSGEVEVDWDSPTDVQVQFKRVDQETLKSMVILAAFNLFFELVFCTGDKDGGDGWRVGEVGVVKPDNTSSPRPDYFRGFATIAEAESAFKARTAIPAPAAPSKPLYDPSAAEDGADDEDDDGYWDQYDRTPARTPAVKRSPAPQSIAQQQQPRPNPYRGASSVEEAYFAQYDTVQPAMDNDDPSQAAASPAGRQPPPPLGLSRHLPPSSSRGGTDSTPPVYTPPEMGFLVNWQPRAAEDARSRSSSPSARQQREEDEQRAADGLLAPRPASSSASSNGSASVARLEEAAARRDQSEFGVRQHITRSVRSLFLLSRASGIDREEFEDMVRRELDVLGMVEDEM